MENYDRLSVLLQKRETIQEHIQSFKEFLDQFDITNSAHVIEMQIRSQNVVSCFATLDELFDEIQLIDSDTDYKAEKKSIQNLYYIVIAKAQDLYAPIIQSQSGTSGLAAGSLTGSDHTRDINTNSNRRKVKLPQASLPNFTGKIEEWLSFKDSFRSMIHDRDDITNCEKLQYLKSVLKDEALRKVQVLSITDDNYQRAWDLLQKAYEDARTLISRHLSLLLRLPVQDKETSTGLIALADESQQHLQSLNSLGVEVNDEILVTLLEEKLHKNTLDKWEETLKKGVFPKLEELTEFIYRTAARISKRKIDQVSGDVNKHNTFKKRKFDNKQQVFLTTSNKCPLCSESHFLFRCSRFLNLSVNERIKIVKDASLCNNCLRPHSAKDCKFGNCKKCNKRHNTLLHILKSQNQNENKFIKNQDQTDSKVTRMQDQNNEA